MHAYVHNLSCIPDSFIAKKSWMGKKKECICFLYFKERITSFLVFLIFFGKQLDIDSTMVDQVSNGSIGDSTHSSSEEAMITDTVVTKGDQPNNQFDIHGDSYKLLIKDMSEESSNKNNAKEEQVLCLFNYMKYVCMFCSQLWHAFLAQYLKRESLSACALSNGICYIIDTLTIP